MAYPTLVRQFLEHRDVVLGFVFALTRDYDVAEEVFQEVALAILQEAGKGTAVESFLAWAQGIARRRVADYYRKANRRQTVEQVAGPLADVVSQAFAENAPLLEGHQERMASLLECLQRLAGRSRVIVESFYQRRQSLREIAGLLGWKEDSVKVALSRARKALADCIENRMRMSIQEA
jgi:RNA polymerase sigma-70 factor (ECF subfamily)